ncbi:ArnT family glycosyltransferase [Oceanomicrobium pacificus]|uniref:Glycosyltransferase n=1 Tax=Oceanomicrobium pacificus TaxID=2692916 RepID=A0A6B0U0H5_9RHOB|nr:glycosyltransferase family 39 protein [Oceanomicrobium pacificus]MXU66743.1 glycosyltransferase [Oceanomicrobium pacificus]
MNETGAVGTVWSRDRTWVLLIAGYFLFQIALRVATGGALGLDEAQMILEGRVLAWGYGPQPPLYAWVQGGAFALFGETILALSLVKNAFLCGTFLTVYWLARRIAPPPLAGLATVMLLTVPQLGWESQRALTHSVLVTFLSVLLAAQVWAMGADGRRGAPDYLVLGALIGFGMIAKYNFALSVSATFLAAAWLPQMRGLFGTPKLLLAVGMALAILAGPGLWMFANQEATMASSHKFEMDTGHWALARVEGLAALAGALLSFMALPLLILGVCHAVFRRAGAARIPIPDDLLLRYLAAIALSGLALIALVVLASGATNVKDRWLQPVLVTSVPALTLLLVPLWRAAGPKRLAQVAGAVALLIPVGLLHHNLWGDAYRAAPFKTLAAELPVEEGTLVLAPVWVAGNLAYLRPDWQVQDERLLNGAGTPDRILLVNADRSGKGLRALPEPFARFFIRTDQTELSAPYRVSGGDMVMIVEEWVPRGE